MTSVENASSEAVMVSVDPSNTSNVTETNVPSGQKVKVSSETTGCVTLVVRSSGGDELFKGTVPAGTKTPLTYNNGKVTYGEIDIPKIRREDRPRETIPLAKMALAALVVIVLMSSAIYYFSLPNKRKRK
jgi:hypothetical protein